MLGRKLEIEINLEQRYISFNWIPLVFLVTLTTTSESGHQAQIRGGSDRLRRIEVFKKPVVVFDNDERADVELPDNSHGFFSVVLSQERGRCFKFFAVAKGDDTQDLPESLLNYDKIYQNHQKFSFSDFTIEVIALDIDLQARNETPDRAGIRVLRSAVLYNQSDYPSIRCSFGSFSPVISLPPDRCLTIGRSTSADVVIPIPEVSGKHLRVMFDNADFAIEDLESTNGTWISGKKLQGRSTITPDESIMIARLLHISILENDKFEQSFSNRQAILEELVTDISELNIPKFPCVISTAKVARPSRLALELNKTISLGRDPGSDMWLGAPFISRHHCQITLVNGNIIEIEDTSTNGTYYDDGVLKSGMKLLIQENAKVLNFGGGITVAVCLTEEQEKNYKASLGSPVAFIESPQVAEEGKKFEFDKAKEQKKEKNPQKAKRGLSVKWLLIVVLSISFVLILLGIVLISLYKSL